MSHACEFEILCKSELWALAVRIHSHEFHSKTGGEGLEKAKQSDAKTRTEEGLKGKKKRGNKSISCGVRNFRIEVSAASH